MRHAVFSDVHANLPALEAVLRDIKSQGIESKFCCGDIVGYGSQPNQCIDRLREEDVRCVSGNHDYLAANLDMDFDANTLAKTAMDWTRSVLTDENAEFLRDLPLDIWTGKIYIAHGSPRNPLFEYVRDAVDVFNILGCIRSPITLLGHTHEPAKYDMLGSLVVNVGSVGQPRDLNPDACYAIIDDCARTVDIRRVKYSTSVAHEGIVNAGLPVYLGQRLAWGT